MINIKNMSISKLQKKNKTAHLHFTQYCTNKSNIKLYKKEYNELFQQFYTNKEKLT